MGGLIESPLPTEKLSSKCPGLLGLSHLVILLNICFTIIKKLFSFLLHMKYSVLALTQKFTPVTIYEKVIIWIM